MDAALIDLLARAEDAAATVGQDPDEALRRADAVVVEARRAGAWEAVAVAERAAARAQCDRGDQAAALRRVAGALRAARRCGAVERVVEAQTTAAYVWFLVGRRRQALDILQEAGASARGPLGARVAAQRILLLWRMGQVDVAVGEARELLRAAARSVRAAPSSRGAAAAAAAATAIEPEVHADLLGYLGGMLGELGRYGEAETAFAASFDRCVALGLDHKATTALYNLALVHAFAGRIPTALRTFDQVEARLQAIDASTTWLLVGRTQVLLEANLVDEALATAERAVASADRRAPLDLQAEAWWRLAKARLLMGDADGARAAAMAASRQFRRLANDSRAAIADRVEVQARAQLRGPNVRLLHRATTGAAALRQSGLHGDAVDASIDVVQLAARLGRREQVQDQVVVLRASRRNGPALQRARAWYGEALGLDALGDGGRAQRALHRGLRLLDDHRSSLGSTELRARASGHGAEMAELGVKLAVRQGRASSVLQWAERWRAGVVWQRPVVRVEVAEALGALRSLRAERDLLAAAGEDVSELLHREARLEAGVRSTTRESAGESGATDRPGGPVLLDDLHGALGDAALVEVVEHDGDLHAVVVAGRRCSLHALGRMDDVTAELDALGFALRRLGRLASRPGPVAPARASADDALEHLDALLLAPLRRRLGDAPLVVVPTAALHAAPWGALASASGRAVTVAPSATWWLAAGRRAPVTGSVTLIAGPGLPGAAAEVAQLAARYARARVLAGPSATVDRATAALDGAALAHLACHGRFRDDNPLFSALELYDGALTVYDLEQLAAPPDTVVLSACDSGLSQARPGNELLGFLSSLFSLGTSAVVASVVPVPDLETKDLMLALHGQLADGRPFAEALQHATTTLDPQSPTGLVTRSAFVCFGNGSRRPASGASGGSAPSARSTRPAARVPSGPWQTT